MRWNLRLRGLTMFAFNFGIESLQQSVKLDLLPRQFPSLNTTFSKPKSRAFYGAFVVRTAFQLLLLRWRKKTYSKRRPLFRSQIFSVAKCCDIQGSHLIGYLWVSLIIDQSECLVCYFLCTELTLFCIKLPENAFILTNQNWVIFFMYIIAP